MNARLEDHTYTMQSADSVPQELRERAAVSGARALVVREGGCRWKVRSRKVWRSDLSEGKRFCGLVYIFIILSRKLTIFASNDNIKSFTITLRNFLSENFSSKPLEFLIFCI